MKRLISGLIVLLVMSINLSAYTRGEIITEIRNLISDTNTDTAIQVFSATLLHSRIDQAEDDINKQLRQIVSRSTVATTCGTMEYEYPETASNIYRVSYDTDGSSITRKYVELTYNTMDGLDRDYSGWDNNTTSGTPICYYYRADYIGIYPAPSFKYSGSYGDLRLDYILTPTTSTSNSTIIFNGYKNLQQFKNCIIDYVCALCARDEDDVTMMNFYWNKYNADLANAQERVNNRPDRVGGVRR